MKDNVQSKKYKKKLYILQLWLSDNVFRVRHFRHQFCIRPSILRTSFFKITINTNYLGKLIYFCP